MFPESAPRKDSKVIFDSLGMHATVNGLDLMTQGLPVRLEAVEDFELLLFDAITPQ